MNFRYLIQELNYRRRRTIISIVGLSIGIALLLILISLSLAYREAARAPLKEIGADITIQRSGNVPKKLAGTVFPCSAVTIKNDELKRITDIPGVSGVGKAVLLWQFDPRHAWIILGIERENTVGPAILHKFVTEGRFFDEGKMEAMLEKSYAYKSGIRPGDKISVAGKHYPVVGLVDASNVPKIALANLYLPIQEAQKLAASSQLLQSVSPFTDEDINLLFIKVEQSQIPPVTAALKKILGNKTTIATPETFLKLLGNMLFLSDKFTMAASVIALLVAILIAFKTMAGNLAERVREIGVMKAVGWTSRNVIIQLLGESLVQCFIAGILGILIASAVAFALSFLMVKIPIPWEMSPVPHFLPGGGNPVFKTLRLPVHIPVFLALSSILLSVFIGGLTGMLLGRHIAKIKPSEVLRHE